MKKRFGFSWGASSSTPAPTTTQAPERRGEVNELKYLLRDPHVERDNLRRRDIIKRILGFMTLGMDTTAVFTELILACVTKDIIQKKMIYFYLQVHSEANNDQAILAINTLQKDCGDDSPNIRGLALRSLAGFRLPSISEYLTPVIKKLLVDSAPYVRKTAVLASLKLYRFAPETFRQMDLTNKMYGMLRDNDPMVCTNALAVLQEVTREDGGPEVGKSVLYFLLNRMRDLNEWQQVEILQLTAKYTPGSEDEMFDIMNLLEERLRGSNSAVILAASHVFLHMTQNLPSVHAQVFSRLKEPLLTLASTAQNFETCYVVLCHIKLLVQREAKVFQSSYKDFYIRPNEPSYIKAIKIQILTTIACDSSAKDIVGELVENVSDMNGAITKAAIAGIGSVALRLQSCAKTALDHLMDLLNMAVEHVRGQTLVVMKDFLRKYNDIDTVRPFLNHLVASYKDLGFQDDDSKVALVWVLGEFGEHIEDAPYILESLSQNFAGESAAMRMEILTALMKLFFKRPPEVQPVLGQVFSIAIADFSHADVHDRALLYYRLLRTNARVSAQVVCNPKSAVSSFVEDDTSDISDRLFEEFNTVSIIFGLPSAQYAREDQPVEDDESEEEDEEVVDEEAGMLAGNLELDPDAELDTDTFRSLWGQFPTITVHRQTLKSAPSADDVEDALLEANIIVLATGQNGPTTTKMFIYAKPRGASEDESAILVELLLQVNGDLQATIKCQDSADGNAFLHIIGKAMSGFA